MEGLELWLRDVREWRAGSRIGWFIVGLQPPLPTA